MCWVQAANPKDSKQSDKLGRPEVGRPSGTSKTSGYRESTVENMGDQRQKDRVAGENRTQKQHLTDIKGAGQCRKVCHSNSKLA